MNKINPKKLLSSKWTAVTPTNKEKHVVVSKIKLDESGMVSSSCIEAVMSKRTSPINGHDLKDDARWVHGWQ